MMIYTIVGRWRDEPAVVTWNGTEFGGTPGVAMAVRALASTAGAITRLQTALVLMGRALDRVDQLRVDDADDPWDFAATPVRPISTAKRRLLLRDTRRPTTSPTNTA